MARRCLGRAGAAESAARGQSFSLEVGEFWKAWWQCPPVMTLCNLLRLDLHTAEVVTSVRGVLAEE